MIEGAEHPWNTAGMPTTTNYAMGGVNEFGQRVPPKPVHNLHGISVPRRDPVSALDLESMAQAYWVQHGKLPTKLYVAAPKQGLTGRSLHVHGVGVTFLDIFYDAEYTHVGRD